VLLRTFVAAVPPPEVRLVLSTLPRPVVAGLCWMGAEQWHVTLRFFGELAHSEVQATADLLGRAAAGTDAAQARGGPALAWLRPNLLVWPVSGLEDLHQHLARLRWPPAVRSPGGHDRPGLRPFHGHLTLARGRGDVGYHHRELAEARLTSTWTVDQLVLLVSDLRPDGARYREVARVELGRPG
jgi:2'-5' RNA ligase